MGHGAAESDTQRSPQDLLPSETMTKECPLVVPWLGQCRMFHVLPGTSSSKSRITLGQWHTGDTGETLMDPL